MKDILVPISPGELIDKITILRIKVQRIVDKEKLSNVQRELQLLEEIWKGAVQLTAALCIQEIELQFVNTSLWDTVEEIHICETAGRFDEHFMALARRVCADNDRRAAIKKQINTILGSMLVEEKSHQ